MTEKQIWLDVILFYFNLKHNLKKDVNNAEEIFQSAPNQLGNKSRFFFYTFLFLSIYSCHQNIRLYFFGNPNLWFVLCYLFLDMHCLTE